MDSMNWASYQSELLIFLTGVNFKKLDYIGVLFACSVFCHPPRGFCGLVVGTKGNRLRAFVAVVFGSIAPRT